MHQNWQESNRFVLLVGLSLFVGLPFSTRMKDPDLNPCRNKDQKSTIVVIQSLRSHEVDKNSDLEVNSEDNNYADSGELGGQSEEEKEMPKTETLMLHMKEKSGRKMTYTKQDASMAGKSRSAVPVKTTSSDVRNDKTLSTKARHTNKHF